MVESKLNNKCYGCLSCEAVCPSNAITIHKNDKGFIIPKVDLSTCINCGKCISVCPIHSLLPGNTIIEAYAAWSIDDIMRKSTSSGGIASICSKAIIQNGGVVYGCILRGGKAVHARIDNLNDISKLAGSKYVQSSLRDIYREIKNDLKNNLVLFIGTPCQVAAIKNSFKNDTNLYTIDILCHGVPSQKMLDEHLDHISKNRETTSLSFRQNSRYVFQAAGENWKYERSFMRDPYIAGFLNGCTLRECCTQCPFAGTFRYSDMTIGDFWGLDATTLSTLSHPEKISLVLPLTKKGEHLLNLIGNDIEMYRRTISEAVNGNYPLRASAKKSLHYRLFTFFYHFLPFRIAIYLSLSDLYLKKMVKLLFK